MIKKILFRVDSGGKIGLGHFYRSWNLAIELSKNNHEIVFVHLFSEFWNEIDEFDFQHITLDSSNPNMNMVNFCLENNFDILYVDGIIDFNKKELEKIKEHTKIIFYQNLSNSKNLADIFILPSLHQEKNFFNSFDLSHTTLYQGLEYFLYNNEISFLDPKKNDKSQPVKNIGIICGGSDPKNVMLTLYQLINTSKWYNIEFNFYFGETYLFKHAIPVNFPDNVNFLPYNLNDINDNDFLIATFGVSTYEFMTLGMPIISLGHQVSNTKASQWISEKTNAIFHLGLIDSINACIINEAIEKMIFDVDYRINLGNTSKQILDLKGFDRIINILENV